MEFEVKFIFRKGSESDYFKYDSELYDLDRLEESISINLNNNLNFYYYLIATLYSLLVFFLFQCLYVFRMAFS